MLLARNGEQVLLALVIPAGILVGGRYLAGRLTDFGSLAPSVLALAVWSTAFTSVAISTGFERRYGVLERLAATPLGRPGLVLGKALAVAAVVVAQLLTLTLLALALGWQPTFTAGSAIVAAAAVVLAATAFVGLALLMAGRLRAEVTLGLANVVYVVMLALGGLVVPVDRYPAAAQPIVQLLPTGALGETVRAAAVGDVLGWPLALLTGWAVAAVLLAWKGFRWTS